MSNYVGYRCPVCGETFAQGDDVVVCPDCGTPHHRACYNGLGHCACEDKHAAGIPWTPTPEEGAGPQAEDGAPRDPRQATAVCPRCGSHNPAGNIFCQVCGHQLNAGQAGGAAPGWQVPPDAPAGGQGYRRYGQDAGGGFGPQAPGQSPFPSFAQNQLNLDQELAPGVTAKDVCDYVGPNGYSFVLKFQAMSQSPGGLSVNWCAFFFSFFYCFYRKMYKLGAALLAAFLAAIVPVFWCAYPFFQEIWAEYGTLTVDALATFTSPASQRFVMAAAVFRAVTFFLSVFCAFFFNRAYFAEVCRNIRFLRENGRYSSGSAEYRYALVRRGGVNSNAVLLTVCAIMVLYILACVGLTYQLM